MMSRYCSEALDRTIRDILRFSNPLSLEQPFGSKTVVFEGDFRQILPIIPEGSRQDIVLTTLNSSYLVILALTLDIVESINDYVSSLNRTEENTYLSSDATCISISNIDIIGDLHIPEFLNAIKCSGVPNHQLKLKVGVLVMLLRTVDHSSGLCNGTRLVFTRLGNHILEGIVISGSNAGFKVFIPRMSLTPLDPRVGEKAPRIVSV
ncbi:hypothetical protein FEM48_Zijuj05G0156600 [Ziziphus jujuba var. spinosa]|uniref:ATP-dependent DNA helicase n=1 Tax=Ziziphus jujuba var. spinosa TaxID=714518 RepID=A0A978VFN6_ZIZJJ|nr:hypothetical protein FEM48_Zijuj05G0156600 [Ziziphus jujuba var. spinosa]